MMENAETMIPRLEIRESVKIKVKVAKRNMKGMRIRIDTEDEHILGARFDGLVNFIFPNLLLIKIFVLILDMQNNKMSENLLL